MNKMAEKYVGLVGGGKDELKSGKKDLTIGEVEVSLNEKLESLLKERRVKEEVEKLFTVTRGSLLSYQVKDLEELKGLYSTIRLKEVELGISIGNTAYDIRRKVAAIKLKAVNPDLGREFENLVVDKEFSEDMTRAQLALNNTRKDIKFKEFARNSEYRKRKLESTVLGEDKAEGNSGKLLKKGICWSCNEPGHMSRDCPKRR